MEKRLAKKLSDYIVDFKRDVSLRLQEFISQLDETTASMSSIRESADYNELQKMIFEYPKIQITQDDFTKRKRVKNVVPNHDRCQATRANQQQCTRKKKKNQDYCGTHLKGVPNHIKVDDNEVPILQQQKVNIWAQNIKGIEYFVDEKNQIYKHEDIISNINNPTIIATFTKSYDNSFIITPKPGYTL